MVMDNESNQERQENELEVLKAIYGEHLQEIEIPIEEWQPLNFVLHLEPQQTSLQQQAHTFVDLHIVCSDKYPYEVPVMKIVKSKGLSTLQIETLHNELTSHAESLKGEVMVFELASFVQALLLQYNKPSFKSLYDEMFNRKVKKQEEEEEEKKVLEELTRKEILMEIKTKKEALKQELRCKSSDDPKEEVYQISTRPDIPQRVKLKKHLPISNLSDIEDINERTQSNIKLEELANFWSISSKKMPRLENEFETLQYLGKGAFGEVLKVRNKLDQCMYAIKVIRLNPGNKPLYRKITREVKLLSRLNHENVVRYYNSWIETCHEIISTTKLQGEVDQTISKTVDNSPVSLTIDDWDMNHVANDDSSEDQSDDTFGISFQSQSGDASKNNFHKENSKQEENSTVEKENKNNEITHNFMYIQMEFCEKSTLRTAIDKGLYEDEKRVWRLLREIIEGLCHIHQQGIIHRDLKPVNVFIDSEDHVKIGDFGLATTNIRHKAGILMDQGPGEPMGPSLTDTSQTGQVGTALYVAPELSSSYLKTAYNQKVDIYSLGIMFFEMCHPPLQTHMERIKVLTNLRLEYCILPADFIDNTRMHKTKLIRDMLIHDPILRPSSADLLQSELLPPPQFEEYEVQELLRHTMKNPQSKLYKHLISLCFNQKISTAQNVTYDMSLSKGRYFMVLLEEVTTRIRKVFRNHGAFSISSPLLLPSGTFDMSNLAVSVMTKWGGVVMLPYDLRLPFARFLAHNPFITQLKRYSIERVYRERRVLGHHPRELYECAFDIVTPNLGNMVAESELLSFVWEVLNQFPVLLENNCLIRLNHTSLIQAIFLHCDIDKSKYIQISRILSQSKEDNFTKAQLESALIAIDLTEHTVCSLLNLLDLENSFGRMFTTLQSIFKRSTSTMILFKQAFHQLEMIINNVSELGVKCPITISLGLLENISYYSGMICQFVWEQRNKQGHNQHHVFASGGRYDNLIAELRRVHGGQYHSNDVVQTAVGITISLDKLVSTLQTQQFKVSPIDVVICSLGTKLITREKLNLARDLWAAGVKTYIFDSLQNLEEIQNICLEMTIFHIVILKDTDPGYVRLRSWIKDRFQEKKVLLDECVDHVLRLCQLDESILSPKTENKSTEIPVINIVFHIGQKLSSAMKRRYESQVYNSILSTIKRLSAKVRVEVIVVNLEADIIKMLAAYIDLSSEDQDWSVILKRFPKQKKIIHHIYEHIQDMKTNISMSTVVLYSIADNMFKVVL